ncbi:MAG: patatin-like phospholipase family protein [Peptostreptococcaceae bacterium]
MRIGLCLAGGGAKGAYQAGVVKALLENEISKFDAISGTSIGAINGYYIYTGNVDKLENVWINIEENSENGVFITNNTVDNSEIIENLEKLDNNSNDDTKFLVNYVKIQNKNIEEIVDEVSKLDKQCAMNAIKYSSLLPYNPNSTLGLREQFVKDVSEGLYEGMYLDGGLIRNTLVEPLIDEKMDKIIVIPTIHNYKLPDRVKSKFDENKIIVVRPNTQFTSKDTLNFSKEFCKSIFEEGYNIGKLVKVNK